MLIVNFVSIFIEGERSCLPVVFGVFYY